jgi:hypothetical protein
MLTVDIELQRREEAYCTIFSIVKLTVVYSSVLLAQLRDIRHMLTWTDSTTQRKYIIKTTIQRSKTLTPSRCFSIVLRSPLYTDLYVCVQLYMLYMYKHRQLSRCHRFCPEFSRLSRLSLLQVWPAKQYMGGGGLRGVLKNST